jgi:hypothetical protein
MKNLYFLRKEIDFLREQIEREETEAERTVAPLSDMPRGNNPPDKLCGQVCLIAALKDRLAAKTAEYEAGYREILDWLNSLSDSQTYLILFSLLINFEDWGTIADNLGGRNCANGVKRKFFRELKKLT